MRVYSEEEREEAREKIRTGEYARSFSLMQNTAVDALQALKSEGQYAEWEIAFEFYKRGFIAALDRLDLYERVFKEDYKPVIREDARRSLLWDGGHGLAV